MYCGLCIIYYTYYYIIHSEESCSNPFRQRSPKLITVSKTRSTVSKVRFIRVLHYPSVRFSLNGDRPLKSPESFGRRKSFEYGATCFTPRGNFVTRTYCEIRWCPFPSETFNIFQDHFTVPRKVFMCYMKDI